MKRLFAKRSLLGLKMMILGVFSISLIAMDHRQYHTQTLRVVLSSLTSPLIYGVNWPVEALHWAKKSFSKQQTVLADNAELRVQQLLLKAKLQKLMALQRENARLRALLKSSTRVGGKVIVAQLLAVNSDPFVRQVVLDKGSKDKVFVGQPVVDDTGVMGQVVQVGTQTSRVLLITDTLSAIPVQAIRTGVRAIAAGKGSQGTLSLPDVPETTDIQQGDVLVTSGLGQRFPPGYPVAVVKKVTRQAGEPFAAIEATPTAKLNQSRHVLLVWPASTPTAQLLKRKLLKKSDSSQRAKKSKLILV